jgi:hypothetical protein
VTRDRLAEGTGAAEPPRAPSIKPKIALSRKQRFVMPLLLGIPILAVLGVFGESQALAHATGGSIDVSVSYPTRFRYRQVQSIHVSVRNHSSTMLDTVSIGFDTAYISRFSSVRFDPAVKTAYTIDLTNFKPGESRLVSVELWGQDYGSHSGDIVARNGGETVMVHLRTFVFP